MKPISAGLLGTLNPILLAANTTTNTNTNTTNALDDNCTPFPAVSIYVIRGDNTIRGNVGNKITFGSNTKYKDYLREEIGHQLTLNTDDPDYPYKNNSKGLPDDIIINQGTKYKNAGNKIDECKQNYKYPCTEVVADEGDFLTIAYTRNEDTGEGTGPFNETCHFYANGIDNLPGETDDGILNSNRKMFRIDMFSIMP